MEGAFKKLFKACLSDSHFVRSHLIFTGQTTKMGLITSLLLLHSCYIFSKLVRFFIACSDNTNNFKWFSLVFGIRVCKVSKWSSNAISSGFEAVLSRKCWIFPLSVVFLRFDQTSAASLPSITVMIRAGFTLILVVMMWCQAEGGLGKWRVFHRVHTHQLKIRFFV